MAGDQHASKRSTVEKSSPVVIHDSSRSSEDGSLLSTRHADDALLAELGYKAEFRREFTVRAMSANSAVAADEIFRSIDL